MRKTLVLPFAFVALGCHRKAFGPPLVVPATSTWLAALDEAIESPLATDEARLFVATHGAVRAIDRVSGKALWRIDGKTGRIAARAGLLVLCEDDGTVTAMDPETGAPRWRAPSGVIPGPAPLLDGEIVLVAGHGVAALDSATGHAIWSALEDAPRVSAPPTPVGGRLLFGEADGTLRCRDRATGKTLWTYPTRGPLRAAAVVDERRRIFLGTTDGGFLALDLDKGRVRWRWRVGADVEHRAVVERSLILFDTDEDLLYGLHRGSGDMDWRALLPSRPISEPLLFGTAALIACREDEVFAFDTKTGVRIGGFRTPSEIRTPPIVLGDRIYLGLRNPWSVIGYKLNMTLGPPLQKPLTRARRTGRHP